MDDHHNSDRDHDGGWCQSWPFAAFSGKWNPLSTLSPSHPRPSGHDDDDDDYDDEDMEDDDEDDDDDDDNDHHTPAHQVIIMMMMIWWWR